MINHPIIVGCGTVGALLAIRLAEQKICSKLDIYDFDIVSEFNENSLYPFYEFEAGIPKIKIVEFYCKYQNPKIVITSHQKRIDFKLNNDGFIIDCRDCKKNNINEKIRISLDGYMLYIDSMKRKSKDFDYHRYIVPKNLIYINRAIDKIIKYLINDDYIYKDFRFYNLETDKLYIIDKEI